MIENRIDIVPPLSDDDKIETRDYYYSISLEAEIPSIDERVELMTYCGSITIPFKFDDHQFPFISTGLNLPKNILAPLQENYRDSKFILNLSKHFIINSEENVLLNNEEKLSDPIYVYESKSLICLELGNVDLDPVDPDNEDVAGNPNRRYKTNLFLFETECLNINKVIVNTVYKKTTLDKVIHNILSINSKKEIVAKKPDNTKEYESILIPPMSATRAINYLQDVYGVYKNGLRFYMDFNKIFISPIDNPKSPSGDYPSIHVDVLDPDQFNYKSGRSYYKNDEDGIHMIRLVEKPMITFSDVSSKEIYGKTIVIGNNSPNTAVIKGIGGGSIDSEGEISKERFYWNKMSHDYNTETFLRTINESVERCELNIASCDIEIFTVDKNIALKYMVPHYVNFSGNYRIKMCTHTFTKLSDGDTYWKSDTFLGIVRT